MTTFDEEQALEIAKYIDQQNNERKDIVTTIAKSAGFNRPECAGPYFSETRLA